jgi:hypothetical protein
MTTERISSPLAATARRDTRCFAGKRMQARRVLKP